MRTPRAAIPLVLTLGLLAASLAAAAQAPQRVFRIGWLTAVPRPPDVATVNPIFRRELLALGWVEGQHYVLEYRFGDGSARLPVLAAELAALPVDVIVALSTNAARAAKAATTTVPIVFMTGGDPVQRGLVASLARPGGNMTGYSEGEYLEDKMLQLLKEAVPGMSRVGWLGPCATAQPAGPPILSPAAARDLGVQVQCLEAKDSPGLARVLASMANANIGGLLVSDFSWTTSVHYKQIADFATTARLPTIGTGLYFPEVGGLLSYGQKPGQAPVHAAALVDKILRGAKPADLPVEQSTQFTFVVNLKTAKAIGLTIPPSLLARADQIIQ